MLLSKFRFYIRDIFNFTQDEALKIYLDFYREKYCEDLAMKKASGLGHRKLIGYFMHKGATNWEDCVLSSSENFHEEIAKFFYEKKMGQELNIPKKKNVDYYYHGLIYAENTCKLAAKKRHYSAFHYFVMFLHISANYNPYVEYFGRAGDTRAVKYYWDRAGRVRSWYYADAVHSGNTELLQYIERKGIYDGPGAVREAIDCRNFDMLKYTLSCYDCPEQFINHTTELGYKDVVEFLFSWIGERKEKEDKIDLDKYMETSIKHKRQNMIRFFLKKIQEKKRRERCIIS